jgi:hypothetical protein
VAGLHAREEAVDLRVQFGESAHALASTMG